jgi:DNA-binding CsgD family transcriptional regulator
LLPEEWLQQLYGLTPAESRLALLLAAGNAPKEAAQQLQVGISTVRSQLKSIFAKTDTNRQSELVRLLLMSPAQTLRGTVKPL